MGIYSPNRVVDAQVQNESAEIASIIESIENTDATGFRGLMETVIGIHENDYKMFNSIIECDFISATNTFMYESAEAEALNEGASQSKIEVVINKIKEVIDNVIGAIAKAAANFSKKIQEFFSIDKALVKKYDAIITPDNLAGFPGIKDFAYPAARMSAKYINDSAVKFAVGLVDKMKESEDRESVDELYGKITKYLDERIESSQKDLSTEGKYFQSQKASWIPTQGEVSDIKHAVNDGKKYINEIKTAAATIIKELKDLKKSIMQERMKTSKRKDGEVVVYRLNKAYKATSTICRVYTEIFRTQQNIAVKQLQAYRKAYLACGSYASKKSKGKIDEKEAAHESVFYDCLGESSDIYVAEFFSMAY